MEEGRVPVRRSVLCACVALASALAFACGGSDGGKSTPAGAFASSPAAASPSPAPTADPATLQRLGSLSQYILFTADVPAGFRLRSSSAATKTQVITAQITIPKLAGYIKNSDLEGIWGAIYTRDDPPAGVSSIIYSFQTAAAAQGFIDTTASITERDYLAAIAVEPVQADKIEDKAQFMRYRITGGRTLEYSWAQGRLAGQVILRYSGDAEGPDDVGLVVSMAREQAQRMRGIRQ
jgi:hypothetical protein